MKKTIKYVSAFILMLALILACFSFVSCGGENEPEPEDTQETLPPDDSGDDGNVPDDEEDEEDEEGEDEEDEDDDDDEESGSVGQVTYVFEAEYIDLEYEEFIVGNGLSGTPSYGFNQIQQASNASNGYAIYATHREGFNLKYEIDSSCDCTAYLTLCLGNELANSLIFTPTEFSVTVNGEDVDYGTISLSAHMSGKHKFYEFDMGEVTLNEGLNTIFLTVNYNELYNGGPAGPLVDYMSLTVDSTVELVFANYYDNISEYF